MRISDWSSDVCSSDLMGNEEIIIFPFFEARIVICIMRLARLPESSVEVRSVGIVRNGWVQIRAATEPAFGRDKKASVHMNGWRSEERRVGKAVVSTCRCRWSPVL